MVCPITYGDDKKQHIAA